MICEDLKGRSVLVTGASSGIGSATAILFSEQDCFVGVHYFRTPDGAEKTLEQVKKNSDGIKYSQAIFPIFSLCSANTFDNSFFFNSIRCLYTICHNQTRNYTGYYKSSRKYPNPKVLAVFYFALIFYE